MGAFRNRLDLVGGGHGHGQDITNDKFCGIHALDCQMNQHHLCKAALNKHASFQPQKPWSLTTATCLFMFVLSALFGMGLVLFQSFCC